MAQTQPNFVQLVQGLQMVIEQLLLDPNIPNESTHNDQVLRLLEEIKIELQELRVIVDRLDGA